MFGYICTMSGIYPSVGLSSIGHAWTHDRIKIWIITMILLFTLSLLFIYGCVCACVCLATVRCCCCRVVQEPTINRVKIGFHHNSTFFDQLLHV